MSGETPLITPVILCGGSGTRLWPLSRTAFPKQFLQLGDELSLFQRTLVRLTSNPHYGPVLVLTNADYRFHVAEQARQLNIDLGGILLEPDARNTAPAIGAAAAYMMNHDKDSIIHVLPSDHLIEDDEEYRAAVETALATAQSGYLATFGINPTEPATGYGYIKAGEELDVGANLIAKFVEKPPKPQAEAMLTKGGYFWNSGMFMFRTDQLLSELKRFENDTFGSVTMSVNQAQSDLDFIRLDPSSFKRCKSVSIDYAVFEHTDKAAVVPSNITWSDVGSWNSLWESREKDTMGNAVWGSATLMSSKNNLVISERQHVALNGVADLTVVATDDAILISSMEQSENIKELVSHLKRAEETNSLTEEHNTVYRPWGGYTSILKGDRFQVKRLTVLPGKKLSLQKHHHRSEHWVVVSGTALVTLDDEVMTLSENESVYIPLGAVHRLENPGKISLEVIEVQSGSYLGEDDIIRIEDDFGRGKNYK